MHNRMEGSGKRRVGLRAAAAVVLVCGTVGLLAACGGGGSSASEATTSEQMTTSSTGGGVSEAQQLVSEEMAPATWTDPGPAIDVGDKLSGKTIFYIAQGLNLPFTQTVVKGMKDAGKVVGLDFVVTDGAGDVSKASRLIDQAVSRNVDMIVIQAFPSDALRAPIESAKNAGIPVMVLLEGDPGPVPSEKADFGVTAYHSFEYTDAGARLAHFVVADSGGNANVVIFNVPDVPPSTNEVDGFTSELTRLCPDCTYKTVDVPIAQWQTQLPTATSSAIKSDPSVNYLFALYDGMVVSMKPSLFAANAADRVKIVSYNADKPNMTALTKADDPEAADVGGALEWFGWGIIDQAARVLLGDDTVESENVPNRTFTKENIDQIDLSADEAEWYGAVDFRAKYKSLWGLG